jgi:hypothetical protein
MRKQFIQRVRHTYKTGVPFVSKFYRCFDLSRHAGARSHVWQVPFSAQLNCGRQTRALYVGCIEFGGLLTSWHRHMIEKLVVAQLVSKAPRNLWNLNCSQESVNDFYPEPAQSRRILTPHAFNIFRLIRYIILRLALCFSSCLSVSMKLT